MFIKNVDVEHLETRLDAGFYNPEYLKLSERLKELEARPLKNITSKIACGPFGGNAIADDIYEEEGLLFIRPINITSNTFDDTSLVKVPESTLLENGLKVYEGENLYFGRVGVPCVALISGKTSISPNIIIAETKGISADPYYLSCFSSSKYGLSQLQRQLKEVAQPTTSTDAVKGLLIYEPHISVQIYIGNKVREANLLQEFCDKLENKFNNEFAFLTEKQPKKSQSWLVKTSQVDTYRLNPKQYDPVVNELLERALRNKVDLVPLQLIVEQGKIAGGATPKGANYLEEGVLFARVQNIKPFRLDKSDPVFIGSEIDAGLKRSQCKEDDILLVITGYPGAASLIAKEDLPVNINQHSVRFNTTDDYDSAYIVAALNSKFVSLQVNRSSIGGTRDALDYPSVTNLLIPILSQNVQRNIAEWLRKSNKAIMNSRSLINSSKIMIEALIEGQITEAQLKEAQQALEEGDNSKDKAILSKLTDKGYLSDDGKPLFTDLDKLYELLDEAKEALGDDEEFA